MLFRVCRVFWCILSYTVSGTILWDISSSSRGFWCYVFSYTVCCCIVFCSICDSLA